MKSIAKTHLENVRTALAQDNGIRIADIYNKLALETKAITLAQYREAARLIVNARLNQYEDLKDIVVYDCDKPRQRDH